jgi:hypothetical protein
MVLGMSLAAYTAIHVVISLIGIVTGLVVVVGMRRSQRLPAWTMVFLVTIVLTSVTGFGFPFDGLKPSHIFGVVSLVILGLAIPGLYTFHLSGRWRLVYVVGSVVALYLNSFVLLVQPFLKIPFLTALAPTGTEPPFAVAQLVVLVLFVVLGYQAVRGFHPEARQPILSAA